MKSKTSKGASTLPPGRGMLVASRRQRLWKKSWKGKSGTASNPSTSWRYHSQFHRVMLNTHYLPPRILAQNWPRPFQHQDSSSACDSSRSELDRDARARFDIQTQFRQEQLPTNGVSSAPNSAIQCQRVRMVWKASFSRRALDGLSGAANVKWHCGSNQQ